MKNFYRIFTLALSVTLLTSVLALAQEVSVSGKVTDETGAPVPGVNVLLKGTSFGMATNSDGDYKLSIPSNATNPVLVFTFIGYVTQEISVSGKSIIDISLSPDVAALSEVVVVGYGELNKREVSTAISSIDTKTISSLPVYRPEAAMQGTLPGVVVLQESGSPGAPLTVRVRGIASAGNPEPLYLVDGVQVINLDFLNASDIESISVLKDAASAAIYGARGGNGVVLVQTKKGIRKAINPKISISGYYGVQSLGNKPDVMNKDQYIQFYNQSIDHYNTMGLPITNGNPGKFTPDQAAKLPDTDWFDAVFDEAPMSNLFANVADGGENYSWSLSGGSYRQDGMVGGDMDKANFNRKSLRATFEKDLLKGLNVSLNTAFAKTDRNFLVENNAGTGFAIMNYISSLPPIYPTRAANGEIFNMGRQNPNPSHNGVTLPVVGAITNPFLALELTNNNSLTKTFSVNGGLSYHWKNFKVATNYSYYGVDQFVKSFIPTYDYPEQNFTNTTASLTETRNRFWRTQWDNTLQYTLPAGNDHNLIALVGMSVIEDENRSGAMNGQGFFVNTMEDVNFGLMKDPSKITVSPEQIDETGWLSYFVRANYSYKEKYLFSATLRSDASSKFGKNNRTGVFPSLSAGWNISEESFMSNIPALDLLKFRVSWGVNGSDRINNYQYLTSLATSAQYVIDGAQTDGIAPVVLANPDIKWEQVAQTNVGVDANLFGNKLGVSVDYYVKKTSDMLAQVGTPYLVGQAAPFKNVADVENRGWEFLVAHKNMIGEFSYNLNVNLTTIRNEVTALNEGQPISSGNVQPSWSSPISRTDVGHPIASFYGYEFEGLDEQGNMRFKDRSNDGVITAADKTYIGNPYPKFVYGITAGANYKGFDFSLFFFGNRGNDIYKAYIRPDAVNVNKPAEYVDSWTGDNSDSQIARSNLFGSNNGHDQVSDYYMEDGSFVKLKTVTLGYTFPEKWSKSIHASKIRFYVTGQNLFVGTKYSGIDPEIGQSSGNAFLDVGIDRGFYPQPRTIMGGFEINLF